MIIFTIRRWRAEVVDVFVDTVAWLALINASDVLHEPARVVMARLRSERAHLTTTEFVLLEVADALAAVPWRERAIQFIDGLRRLPMLTIITVSEELIEAGWLLYRQRTDKSWGLTDCISFSVMQQAHLTQAFTSDHHFTQAGFATLLSYP
jgi:predicted nucleic acid-binding protein